MPRPMNGTEPSVSVVVANLTLPKYISNHLFCAGANIVCESGLAHYAHLTIVDGVVRIIVRHPDLSEDDIKNAINAALAVYVDEVERERATRVCNRCNGSGHFTWSDRETPPNGVGHE